MSKHRNRIPNWINILKNIDAEDLEYVERDLCFYELVSIGFLLFGHNRANAEYILQKLLILNTTKNLMQCSTDLLRTYAQNNVTNWREQLVEALAIINARRVVQKLGFQWEEIRQHYLPHIVELSVHIHPLLKALYKMCEQLTEVQAGRLVLDINQQHDQQEHLRFYDFSHLEIFLLNWLTRNVIKIGDYNLIGADVQPLINHFKLHDMDAAKEILTETIKTNSEEIRKISLNNGECNGSGALKTDPSADVADTSERSTTDPPIEELRIHDGNFIEAAYTVRREHAGIVMIINQNRFHDNVDEKLKPLLPKKRLPARTGTDVDQERLAKVFESFGYIPQKYKDLDHIQLLHNIRETVKRSIIYDSIIICILSHGIDGAVYGSDSIPVEIKDIEETLSDQAIKDKPKMLIIQACQKDPPNPNLPKSNSAVRVHAHDYLDILKGMSSVPGFDSMRHTVQGTWYIQELCDTLDELGDRMQLLDILTVVTAKVTKKRGGNNEIMLPVISSTLCKRFQLPRR